MSDILQEISRFENWFRSDALPMWTEAAWDQDKGGFFETLDFSGKPVRGRRRVRVQSRQVYTFSMAGLLGWHDGAEALAANGFDYLINHACPDDGARGCVHHLDDNGSVIDDRRDLYDQAFLLLACSGRIAAANCTRAAAIAKRTAAFLDEALASPHGGWNESDKGETPRRQNPHMHLFEAFMALARVTGDNQWRARAENVAKLFRNKFYDEDRGVLIEFFMDDLSAPDTQKGAILEPGHMMEWVWLMDHYEKLTGENFHTEKETLYRNARAYADAETGFLPDSVGAAAATGARRLWPQTEYIKAAMVMSTDAGDEYAKDGASIIDACFETYLNQPVDGLWCDQFDGAGAPVAKDVPASILYHLFEAIAETRRYVKGKSGA